MNKKIKRLATTAIICVLVASIFGSVMVLAPAPDLVFPALIDVFVTNTNNDPVPVDVTDSTLDVTLEEPIDVTLDEPIDVTLDEPIEVTNPSSGSLDVEVTNIDTNPIPVQDVDSPERQPFAYKGRYYTVPADKRLVIELFTTTAWGDTSKSHFYEPYVAAFTNGSLVYHWMSVTTQDYPLTQKELYIGTHQVQIYADPGTQVEVYAGFANVNIEHMSISGYLEDLS